MSGPYTEEELANDEYKTEGPAIYAQHIFIEDTYMGTIMRPKYYYKGSFVPPEGVAFWCGLCSRVWAILLVDGQITTIDHCICEKHKVHEHVGYWNAGWGGYPGSVFMNFGFVGWIDATDLEWPKEVIKREFLLYCERHGIK